MNKKEANKKEKYYIITVGTLIVGSNQTNRRDMTNNGKMLWHNAKSTTYSYRTLPDQNKRVRFEAVKRRTKAAE